jgi:hypothetical protein
LSALPSSLDQESSRFSSSVLAAFVVVKLLLAKDGVDLDSKDTDGLPYN